MDKITFHAMMKEGPVKVRYRIRLGRMAQICYTSDIECEAKDLAKFKVNGERKERVTLYNPELSRRLNMEYDYMVKVIARMTDEGMDMTSAVFNREINALKNPVKVERKECLDIVERFRKYADEDYRAGIIGANRHKHIIVVSDKLERFLFINGISNIKPEDFDIDLLMAFREFLFDEYLYVQKNKKLYESVKDQNKPQARLSMNTVTSQLKMFQTFFNVLEDQDEIRKSPFRKLGKERRKAVMRTKYDDPYYLDKKELMRVLKTDVGPILKDTKDAFLVQCAFGCRISDFAAMSMDSIAVSDEGIPYVHYLPQKTANSQEGNTEVQTPIVRYAFDIIKRTGFHFPILRNLYGVVGYNARIKSLLQICQIDRKVAHYNEETQTNEYIPLYKVGSSKLARKTHVDMMTKVQVDLYASGLHKQGSAAVNRYTHMELKDRFALMNAAFEQEAYKVNEQLVII